MALLQIKHRCPHCSELCDFLVFQLSELRDKHLPRTQPPLWDDQRGQYGQRTRVEAQKAQEGCALSRCPRCYNPVMFVVSVGDGTMAHYSQMLKSNQHAETRIQDGFFKVEQTYPEARNYDAHPTWPQKIKGPFVDAMKMLDEGKTPSIIITACRSVLDVVTKDLDGSGKSIFERIDDLAGKGLITGALKDWSHEIRKRGADAVHDLDDGTPGLAKEFIEFIRLLLEVVYELPAAISERQRAAQSQVAPV